MMPILLSSDDDDDDDDTVYTCRISLCWHICRCPVTSTIHPWRCMRPHWWPACQNLSGRLSLGEAMGVIMKKHEKSLTCFS